MSYSDSELDHKRAAKRRKRNDMYLPARHGDRRKRFKQILKLHKAEQIAIRKQGYFDFRTAVEKGNKERLISVLKQHVRISDEQDSEVCSKSAIQLAIYLGHYHLIGTLIEHGYSTRNLSVSLCESPKSMECLNELILYGNKMNYFQRDDLNRTILFAAAVHRPDKYDFIKRLIDMGYNLNCTDESLKGILHRYVLEDFSTKPYMRIAELLIESGIDIELRDNQGETALESAVVHENHDMIRLLLSRGASTASRVSATIAHRALERGLTSCLQTIIRFCVLRSIQGKKVDENLMTFITSPGMDAFHKFCLFQLDLLKNQKIMNTNWSVYDFLCKRKSIIAKYIRNEDLLAEIQKCIIKNSEFRHEIEEALRDAVNRKQLEESSEQTYRSVFQLPELCSEILNSYLNDDDLRNVCRAWED